MNIPTIEMLKQSGREGITVQNPDNGLVFRVALWYWGTVPLGVRIYLLGKKRPVQSPCMSQENISHWLKELLLYTPEGVVL